jgi:hypothetical protein
MLALAPPKETCDVHQESFMRLKTESRSKLPMTAVVLGTVLAVTTGIDAQGQGGGRGGAQQAPPVRLRVQVTQVKPDMSAAFQDVQKNSIIPAMKKAGRPWHTFVTVYPIASYAEFDQQPGALQRALGADEAAKVIAKLTPTIVGNRSWIQTLNQNMSISSNATTPPALVVVQDFQLIPGKNQEFADLMTSVYRPAYIKAGVKDFWVYNVNFGGPAGLVSTVRPIAKYAELDPQPGGGLLVRGGLTQEAAQLANQRRQTLVSGGETNLYRYVPDLSYGMPAPMPARAGN